MGMACCPARPEGKIFTIHCVLGEGFLTAFLSLGAGETAGGSSAPPVIMHFYALASGLA